MSDQWSDWQRHDGRAQIAPNGTYVQVQFVKSIIGCDLHDWRYVNEFTVEGFLNGHNFTYRDNYIRAKCYRIRKPKGLTLLEEIAKNPERELEEV